MHQVSKFVIARVWPQAKEGENSIKISARLCNFF